MANEDKQKPTPDREQEHLLAYENAAMTLNTSAEHDRETLNGRFTLPLIFAVLSSTIGGSFQFGYNLGCINAPGKLITNWFVDSHQYMFNSTMTNSEATFVWSCAVAIFSIGGVAGGLTCGLIADKFGRKGSMLLNNFFALMAAALMGMAKRANAYPLIILGRLIIGLSSGLAPMYLIEISPVNLRGTLGSIHQLMVTIAILLSQIIGLPYLLGNDQWWPAILALTAFPALFQLATLPFCPESPKYNLIIRNRLEQATKDLKKLRGDDDVQTELGVIEEEAMMMRQVAKVQWSDMFTKATLRWPLFIAVMMMLSQQFSGINAAMFYSTVIFVGAGLTGLAPFYATIAMGFVNVMQTILSVWLVDHPKFGRRSLHLIGLGGMWISTILLVLTLSIFVGQEAGKDIPGSVTSSYQWASYLAILFVLTFVVSFATGPGSIPWFYVSEIFALSSRGNANSIAVCVNWAANFFVSVSFLPIHNTLHQYSFLVFTGFLTVFFWFTYMWVPETKGRTVDQIVESFEQPASKNQ